MLSHWTVTAKLTLWFRGNPILPSVWDLKRKIEPGGYFFLLNVFHDLPMAGCPWIIVFVHNWAHAWFVLASVCFEMFTEGSKSFRNYTIPPFEYLVMVGLDVLYSMIVKHFDLIYTIFRLISILYLRYSESCNNTAFSWDWIGLFTCKHWGYAQTINPSCATVKQLHPTSALFFSCTSQTSISPSVERPKPFWCTS